MSANRMYPKIFYWLTPPLACALTLVLVELCLALFRPVPFASEHNMYYEADPYTGFRLRPNSTGRFRSGVRAYVNSHGHRDDEVPRRKPPGTFRVMVLGDSFTLGSNVSQNETYSQVLEKLLAKDLASDFEVINTGVGGWHPFQYAQYYEHYGRDLDPNMVLVGFFVGNDAFSSANSIDHTRTAVWGRRVKRQETDDLERTKRKIALYTHSHLVRLFLNQNRLVIPAKDLGGGEGELRDSDRFTNKYLQIQAQRAKNHQRMDATSRRRAENSVSQIARIKALAGNKPVLVVLIPDENQVNRSLGQRLAETRSVLMTDLAMPQKLLVAMLEETGIGVIDPLPDFLADNRRLYMNDSHWTAAGHRLAAERIFTEIRPMIENRLGGLKP